MRSILYSILVLFIGFVADYSYSQRTPFHPNSETVIINKPISAEISPIPTVNGNVESLIISPTIMLDVPIIPSQETISTPAITYVEPPTEIPTSEIVPTQVPADTVLGEYDPSLYDEWHPYVEPTQGASVSIFSILCAFDLDDLWDCAKTIASSASDCAYPLPTPFVTWNMADRLSILQSDRHSSEEISISASIISSIASEGGGYFPQDGNIRLLENDVIWMLLGYPNLTACKNIAGFPDVYGAGIQQFLDDLYLNYRE